ncbi:MAG: electron transfer flavoprotein subunit beta/FixA family protein [Rickettsiales bacterium]
MKILVPVKRVLDYTIKARVKPDGSGVDLSNVKMSMNPFDEIAVEEALKLKEKGVAAEVIVLSIGTDAVVETLRTGLAMGADRAIHIKTDQLIQPLAAAKLIKHVVEKESPQIVILGKQAIDDDANQTGQMLAALLNWGQGTFASKVDIGDGTANVTREVDGGLMRVSLKLPCVITTDLRLNQPRYASLPNIMKARSKPVEAIDAASLGIDLAPRLSVQKVEEPPKRKGGGKVKSVEELVDKLKNEAKVL